MALDLPIHVLPSGANCNPGEGQRQRTSPFTTSQPYWQFAMEHVRASVERLSLPTIKSGSLFKFCVVLYSIYLHNRIVLITQTVFGKITIDFRRNVSDWIFFLLCIAPISPSMEMPKLFTEELSHLSHEIKDNFPKVKGNFNNTPVSGLK